MKKWERFFDILSGTGVGLFLGKLLYLLWHTRAYPELYAMQSDERYNAMMAARQASDEDEALQEAIGEFNLKRMAISNEAQKEERDDETLRRLNDEFRAVYQKIMENEHMLRYNDAKNEFDALLQQMTGILSLCAEGEDPATCDASSCGGNCASCGGCH